MAISLPNLAGNPKEEIHKTKCKDCDRFREYVSVKKHSIKYKFSPCNKDYSDKINEELNKRFKNTLKFSNNDTNKFFLLLRKGVYLCEWDE